MGEEGRNLVEPRLKIDRLQDLLLLRRLQVEIGGDKVCKRRRRTGAFHRRHQFTGRGLRKELQRLQRLAAQMQEARLDLRALGLRFRNAAAAGDEEGEPLHPFVDLEPFDALASHVRRPIGPGDVAQDVGQSPHAMQGLWPRIGRLDVLLQREDEGMLFAERLLGGRDRARTVEHDREHDAREDDVGHWNDDDRVVRQVSRAVDGLFAVHRFCPALRNVTVRHPFSACQSIRP